jgi:4-amino-4-deoxy-L-arabinose transferase-like glycosyltransferase
MKIYNITFGQLITIIIFGILFWLSNLLLTWILFINDNFWFLLTSFFLLLSPFVLIFYFLGWKNLHNDFRKK